MLFTVTIGQLLIIITCGAVIGIFIYILQTLGKLRNTVKNGTSLITRNEEHISQIIQHMEQITSNANKISCILGGRNSLPPESTDFRPQDIFRNFQDLKLAFKEVSRSAGKFRKTVRKLGR